MLTISELDRMSQIEITNVDRTNLVDIQTIKIDPLQSAAKRMETQECDKKVSRFVYHMPINNYRVPITASAGGIFISTHGCSCLSDLTLTLLSSDSVQVNQASICVIEIYRCFFFSEWTPLPIPLKKHICGTYYCSTDVYH